MQLRAQRGHPQHRLGGVSALIALAAAGAGQRLLHRLAREHSKRTWHAGVERYLLDPAGGLGADVVVVAGLAPDHCSQTGHAGETARLRRVAGGQRQLEGTWHVEHLDVDVPGPRERIERALFQAFARSS